MLSIESCVDLGIYAATGHRRTGQHPFGGSNRVLPEWRTQIVCSRPGVTISKLNRKSQVTMQLRYDLRKVTIREMTISKAS